jgi:hypothetical protein
LVTYERWAVHQSFLSSLSKCALQAYYIWIEGFRIPPGIAAHVGSGVDAGVVHTMTHKKREQRLAPLEEMLEVAAKAVRVRAEEDGIQLGDEDEHRGIKAVVDEGVDKAVRLARVYHYDFAPHKTPIAVAHKIRIDLSECGSPFDIECGLDLVLDYSGHEVIDDTKTSGKSYGEDAALKSIQLPIYAMARELETKVRPRGGSLSVIVDTATPKSQHFFAAFPDQSIPIEEAFWPTLDRFARAVHTVQTGAFNPVDPSSPSGWVCRKANCGFWQDKCPHGRRAQTLIAISPL